MSDNSISRVTVEPSRTGEPGLLSKVEEVVCEVVVPTARADAKQEQEEGQTIILVVTSGLNHDDFSPNPIVMLLS